MNIKVLAGNTQQRNVLQHYGFEIAIMMQTDAALTIVIIMVSLYFFSSLLKKVKRREEIRTL